MRLKVFVLIVLVAAVIGVTHAQTHEITVYKTPTCGCCGIWVAHLRDNGFRVRVTDVDSTADYQKKHGVPNALRSCHTATVNGYTIEGHVPASEIQRLLKERPKAKGLAVPGMPVGSPGMEVGDRRDAYSVVLFDAEGKTSVYRRYTAR
jgi:hypothetical protein